MCFLSCAPFLCFWECRGLSPEDELEHAEACERKLFASKSSHKYFHYYHGDCQKVHQYFQKAISKGAPGATEKHELFKERLKRHNAQAEKYGKGLYKSWGEKLEQERLLARTNGERLDAIHATLKGFQQI